jgi:hypothetical protein
MRRLLRLAARIYPAAWRDRYGIEFQALLDDMKPGWRDILNVLNGGVQMRLKRANPALTVAVFAMLGALAAGVVAYSASARFASTGTISVRSGTRPAASATPMAEDLMPGLARAAFSRDFLTAIIQRHDLYAAERAQTSTDDLVNRMRGDILIQRVSGSVVHVSFASADARRAQLVTGDLLSRLVNANLTMGRGSVAQIIDPPDEPQAFVSPRHVAMAGLGGLSGGALIGMLVGFFPRRRDPLGS